MFDALKVRFSAKQDNVLYELVDQINNKVLANIDTLLWHADRTQDEMDTRYAAKVG